MPKLAALQEAEQRKNTILIVEDNPNLLYLTYEILEYENYQVTALPV